jgi:hypothetical protein
MSHDPQPSVRPRHLRMMQFMRVEMGRRTFESFLALTAEMSRDPMKSRFASKFGCSSERAVDQMIDIYGWWYVAGFVHTDWSPRLETLVMNAYETEVMEWEATLSDGLELPQQELLNVRFKATYRLSSSQPNYSAYEIAAERADAHTEDEKAEMLAKHAAPKD